MNKIILSGSLVVYKPDLDVLERTLLALQVAGQEVQQKFIVRLQLTLVDNSDDDLCFNHLNAWLENLASALSCWEVRLLRSPNNIGYGRANNLVIEQAESDYHFVINPDLFVDPKSLAIALNFMQINPDVGLLVPSVFGEDGRRHYLCKRNPTLFILFLRSFAPAWLKACFKSTLDRFEMRDRNYDEIMDDVEFPSGCFMLFRTRIVKQLKGFDPAYFMYFEDADIGRRMLKIARVVYVPAVKVVHKWERGSHSGWHLRWVAMKSGLIYLKKQSLLKPERTTNDQKSFGNIASYDEFQPSERSQSENKPTKKKRILILVVYYMPSIMSSAKLIEDLAREFHSLGHEVIVAAPDDTILEDCEMTEEAGIKVLRIRNGEIKSALRWVRAWREMVLSMVMWHKGKAFFLRNPCDLIVYYSPTIFFGALIARLKHQYQCPSYLILRDIFPQWAVDAKILRRGSLIHRFFQWKEKRNYDAATVIGIETPANFDYFSKRGLAHKYRLEVLYNWAAATNNCELRGTYRKLLKLQDKVVFFYGGNIGVVQDMDNIVRLAAAFRNESTAYFLLVGNGSEVPRLKSMITAKGLTNIAIHPPVDQAAYLGMLSEFDVGLVSLDRGLKTHNYPGKILSYMDQAKPVLASINPGNDLKDILEEHDAGLVCINGDDERFEMLARRLLTDSELRTRLGRNARAMLDDCFSVRRAAGQILSHFKE